MSFNLLGEIRKYWRLAEIRLLFLALLVAVVAVTSVGFFTDRADRAMNAQATQLLGGDMVIVSTRPISESYLDEAESRGLRTARMVTFPSMVSQGDKFQLSQIQAVSKSYPLHGSIEVSDNPAGDIHTLSLDQLPVDQALAEGRLFVSLGVNAGETVQLGKSTIELSKIIRKMPNQSSSAFQFAPKLLLPLEKLTETGLLSAASRARYSFLFAGDESQIKDFSVWLKPKLQRSERIRTLEDGLPSVQQALQRGQRFLKMSALLAVILAGAGIALSSYSLMRHETSSVAVLKTIGASRYQILRRYLYQITVVAITASILGSILGYFIQFYLAGYLKDFIGQTLPDAGFLPVIIGFLTAIIMALGFSVPHLIQLLRTSPVEILQRTSTSSKTPLLLFIICMVLAVFGLMWIQTYDFKLSLYLLAAVIASILLFWFIAIIMLRLIRWLGQYWRIPKANRRMAIMVVVFGVGLFSLLLLTTLRSDLINRWQSSLPTDAPNHFFINIQPNEVDSFKSLLATADVKAPIFPMIRGRLVQINGRTVTPNDDTFQDNQRAQRLLIREFNLSASDKLPEGNILKQGKWFDNNEKDGFSMELGIAETLGVSLGDTLTFDIAGEKLQQTITSLRTVQWDSMKPNFFVLGTPEAFKDFPKTYITSIHLSDNQSVVLSKIVKQFPSVTDIDLSAIIAQVRDLINKAAFAVQAIFLFTLVAGVVVLFSALQSQKALRRKELAIFKSLGAKRSFIRRNLLIEFAMIGAIAGFVAGVLALVAGNAAAYILFDLTPSINIQLVAMGTIIGALLVSIAGYLNVRGLLSVAPASLFR